MEVIWQEMKDERDRRIKSLYLSRGHLRGDAAAGRSPYVVGGETTHLGFRSFKMRLY